MTNCKSFIDELALMALDELSENEMQRINQHLAECASCAEHFKELQEVTLMLGHSPADKITELEKLQIENAVYRRLAYSPTASPRQSWIGTTLRLAAALALICLGYVGGIFSIESRPLRPEPLSVESQLASYEWNKNVASFRFSPQGLKLIARGRESLKSN